MKKRFFSLLLIFAILLGFGGQYIAYASKGPTNFKIVGAITWANLDTTWGIIGSNNTTLPSEPSLKYLTDLVGPAIVPTSVNDGTIKAMYGTNLGVFTDVVNAAHSNGVKAMPYLYMLSTDLAILIGKGQLNTLVNSITNLINTYNLDGIELDVESPVNVDQTSLDALIDALYNVLHPLGKLLTTVGMAGKSSPDLNLSEESKVDWIDVMCYDMNGSYEDALYTDTVTVMQKWLAWGFSASKLNMGVPFYGYDTAMNGYDYDVIVNDLSPTPNQDTGIINGLPVWWSGIDTTKQKVTWAMDNGLGGIMCFAVGYDKLNTSYSLLKATYDELYPGSLTPLSITTSSLPNGTVGVAYSQTLVATGGTTPYTWTITSGTLPAGLSLSSSGVISGTPITSGGPTSVTFQVTDSTSAITTEALSITINSTLPNITTSSLPNGTVGVVYSQTLAATGGTTPYTWTITSGTLAAGLSLNSSGVISGTPITSGGPTSITFQVTDSASATATKSLSITVGYAVWDVNKDGVVNVLDMILISQHYGETGTLGWIREDVNNDGIINVLDTILVGQHLS